MTFKRHEPKVHEDDIRIFATQPVILAVLIEAGFMTHWPHCWTRDGLRSRRRNEVPDSRHYNGYEVFIEANNRLHWHGAGGAIRKGGVVGTIAKGITKMSGDQRETEAIDP